MKITNILTVLIFCITLSACSSVETQKSLDRGAAQWDFDHSVQFRQTKLTGTYYQLEIIPNNNVNFERLATFLLRQSYRLCGSYHYKIEMIRGIEGFDDKRAMPNYIFPSLIAKVDCSRK